VFPWNIVNPTPSPFSTSTKGSAESLRCLRVPVKRDHSSPRRCNQTIRRPARRSGAGGEGENATNVRDGAFRRRRAAPRLLAACGGDAARSRIHDPTLSIPLPDQVRAAGVIERMTVMVPAPG